MIVHDIEQGSDDWFAIRAGKPTASEASKLVTSKGAPSDQMPKYAQQLAAELYAGGPVDRWEGNQWTERGKEMEDRARAFYENTFPDRLVTAVGFCTDDHARAGASPDSLVEIDIESPNAAHVDRWGMLEIKCPKASTMVSVLLYFDKHDKLPSTYVAQPQMQMVVTGRSWCDVLIWHPDLPPLVARQHLDDGFRINLGLQINSCIDERDRIIEVLRKY